ncbi:MAG: hypothetical protein JWP17_145 [Solirubrobacterales bacterium]|jgi:hypothetical protein|nr:hypothetical protein [Solirubrobacterales bacterium]
MSAQPDHRQYVRRVVLPSGKTIEVVYFEPQQDDDTGIHPVRTELHVCGSCSSELVYPIDWEEAGTSHWQVTLRCPNCEWAGTGVFEQHAVERFDEELDRGTHALVRDLKRMVQANMEEQVERFIEALKDDLIFPEDF